MPNNDGVYIGFWRDFSQNPVLGSRLTLPFQGAAALLAFLAIVVTIVASRSWRILCFLLHLLGDWSQHGNDAFRQQRILLRNGDTDFGVVIRLARLVFMRRSGLQRWALVPLLLVGLAHWALFTVAGVLTFEISRGSTVLGDGGENCGVWLSDQFPSNPFPLNVTAAEIAWLSSVSNDSLTADSYVRNCYDDDEGIGDCNRLVTRRLEWTPTHNASCPFAEGTCADGNQAAFTMDTGNISVTQLGINTHSRFSFRRKTTCAPLEMLPFIYPRRRDGRPNGSPAQNLEYLKAPPQVARLYSFFTVGGENLTLIAFNDTYAGYRLEAYSLPGMPENTSSTGTYDNLSPQPPLVFPDSDLTIIFLTMNGVFFVQPSYDPFFSATLPFTVDVVDPAFTAYSTTYFATALACVDQAQLCNLDTQECGPWQAVASESQLPLSNGDLSKSPIDEKGANALLTIALQQSIMSKSTRDRGPAALLATQRYVPPWQYSIEREQWKYEVAHWFNIALAQMQLAVLRVVHNSRALNTTNLSNRFKRANETDIREALCKRVKFKLAGYTSLSTFGVFFVLAFAFVITMTTFFEDAVLALLTRGRWTQKRAELWQNDDMLQPLKSAPSTNGESGVAIPLSTVTQAARQDAQTQPDPNDDPSDIAEQTVSSQLPTSQESPPSSTPQEGGDLRLDNGDDHVRPVLIESPDNFAAREPPQVPSSQFVEIPESSV
jgi:hypothetical protein